MWEEKTVAKHDELIIEPRENECDAVIPIERMAGHLTGEAHKRIADSYGGAIVGS